MRRVRTFWSFHERRLLDAGRDRAAPIRSGNSLPAAGVGPSSRNGCEPTPKRVGLSATGAYGFVDGGAAAAVVSGFCPTSLPPSTRGSWAIGVDCARRRREGPSFDERTAEQWKSAEGFVAACVSRANSCARPSVTTSAGGSSSRPPNATQTARWAGVVERQLGSHTSSCRERQRLVHRGHVVGIVKLGPRLPRDRPPRDAGRRRGPRR